MRLSEYIRNEHPTTQKIQGFLSDLLADDELLEVMQNVVGRPSFQALEMLASSGEGSAQRDALIHELTRRYLPVIVDDIGELLNGLLDLPAGKTNRPQSSAFNPSDSQVLPKPCAENINTIVDLSQVSERLLSMLDETEAPKPETRETTIYAENPNKPSRQIKRLGVITGTIAALVTSPYLIWIHLGLIPTPTYLPIS